MYEHSEVDKCHQIEVHTQILINVHCYFCIHFTGITSKFVLIPKIYECGLCHRKCLCNMFSASPLHLLQWAFYFAEKNLFKVS